MWKYLRFGYIHWAWFSVTIAGLLGGGWWMWSGVVFLFVVGVGGEIATKNWRDESNPQYSYPIIHDLILYSAVIGHMLVMFVAVWVASAQDLFGFGQAVNGLLAGLGVEHDVFAARAGNAGLDFLGAGLSLGGVLGVSGISAAHELTHRTASPLDMWFGRWDFALSFGGNFATEHVYGHHRQLGNPAVDPVSPKRGIGFYEFLTLGTWRQWRGGFDIEKRRLEALGMHWLSPHNRVLQAWARGTLVVALVILASGVNGLAVWFIAACFSKYILEGLNFFSHYGLIRIPGAKVTTRNTFSSINPLSNHFTFNLGRHGSHHENDTPYYQFQYKDMPLSPYGYLTMTLISWIPPLFWKFMLPMLKEWDEKWATAEELKVIAEHNRESGIAELMAGSSARSPSAA
jgi:Fatty acid desaturase